MVGFKLNFNAMVGFRFWFRSDIFVLFNRLWSRRRRHSRPGDNNPPSPPYNIYGKVSDLNGRAIPGATVSAYYKDDPQQTILDTCTTDAQGQYHLWVPVVVGKTYEIKVEKNGYQPATEEIQLSPSAPSQEVNFTLTPNKR